MSTPPPERPATRAPEPSGGRSHRLPIGTAVVVGILLAIPCLALALVPIYSRETPRIGGWPFFYWYQLAWVLITPILTITAYLLIKRARGEK